MNSDKYGDGPDPYTYPNSQVLINKFGITDDDQFIEMEKDFSELAIMEIEFSPPPYDFRYWCALHQALFGDIYHWAGELRTIDISKGTTRFCNINRITPEANRLFNQLAQENYLVGLPYDALIVKLAEYYSDLNVIHPFREGNGRAQRLLFEHLVINCGFHISFASINPDEWIQANIDGYHCRYQRMTALFARCIS
ncbi:putative adenosine monophosphate-protein transferase Fic [Yersinia aleksiciae]|uniref:putative adenosine monophosphate-protein transferase Fic n=1 Tax=Yersinia aleksiciae TaxID=263819 RepID=UPI0011A797FC|nr:putative adenosine monophosphate-protein transferase Fic [Yersinia aleksiciae]